MWQSSKLAPLVCEFGWAICVYIWWEEWEGGLRSLTHGHYTHTEHTHTHNAVCVWWCWTFECNYTPLSLNRTDCFPRRWASSWLATFFILWNASHTDTKVVGAHTHTHKLLLWGRLSPFLSHFVLVRNRIIHFKNKWHDQDEKKWLDENPVKFHQQAMVSFGFLERRSTRRRNRDLLWDGRPLKATKDNRRCRFFSLSVIRLASPYTSHSASPMSRDCLNLLFWQPSNSYFVFFLFFVRLLSRLDSLTLFLKNTFLMEYFIDKNILIHVVG